MANGFRDSTDNMSYMAGAGLHRRIFETHKLAGFYVYAGLNAFVMTRLGFTDVAVYTASLQEWAADPANPLVVD